jgi:hypothetical protein
MNGSCRGRAQYSVLAIEGVEITRHLESVVRVCGHEHHDRPGRWLVSLSTFYLNNLILRPERRAGQTLRLVEPCCQSFRPSKH